jgi:broad specificity phosphatase PhoE
MLSTQVVLIRHGHTAGNYPGPATRMSGWTDLPLTEQGRHQTQLLCRRLRAGAPFDAIYTSPLQRARDTAQPLVAAGLGLLRVERALGEIHCGEADGLPVGEVQRRFPRHWEANLRQDDADFRWPGGESYREFRERCLGALDAIAAAHPGGRVAVVTHAGVVTQVVGASRGAHPARWELFRVANTALTELTWHAQSALVVSLDDHTHLLEEAHLRPRAACA